MLKTRLLLTLSLLLPSLAILQAETTAPAEANSVAGIAPRSLIPDSDAQIKPDNDKGQLTTVLGKDGITVTIQPGEAGYPGFTIVPSEGKTWDLGAFGHIEAKITNLGEKPLDISLRVDDNGDWKDSPTNTESTGIKPGETKTFKVVFGYSYGGKPSHKLKSEAVKQLLFFTGKKKVLASFRVEEILASGSAGEKPPVDPNSVRTVPPGGVIYGPGVTIDPVKQIAVRNGAVATVAADTKALQITFAGGKDEAVTVKPALGKWRLVDYNEVKVKIKNTGQTPVTPIVTATSGGANSTAPATATLAPGEEAELVTSFLPATPWDGADKLVQFTGGKPGSGTSFESDNAAGVTIASDKSAGAKSLEVTSIVGGVSIADVPAWVGQKPPVDGDWVKTFDDEFDGSAIDYSKWNVYADNFWDKRTHFSKDNVIVKDGKVIFRYEKKTGNHNDDPKGKVTDYVSGFADTYGKWTQRYGYFEARMKLPKAGGLWPALWLMPDRGIAEGPQWKRASTSNGGMEFDIMEFLSGWGPYRFNIAMHIDGYGKEHKQIGSTCIYIQPDKDGYITSGLLWTPGSAIYYCNGKEILRYENPRVGSQQSDIMFTAVSGGWANTPLEVEKLPDDFIVDYVRVWQRKDLATPEDGPKTNDAGPRPPALPPTPPPAAAAPAAPAPAAPTPAAQ